MEYDNVLYVIGNGFDRHHHVKSSYEDFRDWLRKYDMSTYDIYETVCEYNSRWSDFETSLAYVSRDYLLGYGEILLPDPRIDPMDWQIADIVMGGDAASNAADEILDNLKKDLRKWICSLRAPIDYDTYKLPLDFYARFLTFNYTLFLEEKYGIESERVNHIHGKKTDSWKEIIVGHGENNQEVFDKWWNSKKYNQLRVNKKGKKYYKRDFAYKCYKGDTQYLPEYEMITDAVESYYNDSQKDVSNIIRKNEDYFQSLSDIKYIYVWGFSFAKVDMPYLKKIVEVNTHAHEIKWYISYYCEEEKGVFEGKMKEIGVGKEMISFQKLEKIMISSSNVENGSL